MLASPKEASHTRRGDLLTARNLVILLVSGFSLYYFADVLLRASEKYFWYDELVTVYLCRLPTLHDIHEAVIHATDFNPPLFYVITRGIWKLFGQGLISTRLPEILGFWMLCLCLFTFVYRRAGLLAGIVAMTLPMLTQAYYYAYEARPHGIVLGFCGLALLCWQSYTDRPARRIWLVCFSICLLGALMNHCYALVLVVPFALGEIVHTWRTRRISLSMWAAIAAPAIIALMVFIPLLRSYRAGVAGTQFGVLYFKPSLWSALTFYFGLVSPCIAVILVLFVLLATDNLLPRLDNRPFSRRAEVSYEEITIAVSFFLLPFFGVLAGILIRGPFIGRYFMSTVIGFSVLVAFAVRAPRARNRAAVALMIVVVALLARMSLALVWHRIHGVGERLYEAGTGMLLETTPGDPLKGFSMIAHLDRSRPIAILWTLDYLYLTYYAPPDLLSHLYYIGCSSDPESIRAIHVVRTWTRGHYNAEVGCGEFIASHPDFVALGFVGTDAFKMIQIGATVKSSKLNFRTGRFFAEMRGNPDAIAREKALPVQKVDLNE